MSTPTSPAAHVPAAPSPSPSLPPELIALALSHLRATLPPRPLPSPHPLQPLVSGDIEAAFRVSTAPSSREGTAELGRPLRGQAHGAASRAALATCMRTCKLLAYLAGPILYGTIYVSDVRKLGGWNGVGGFLEVDTGLPAACVQGVDRMETGVVGVGVQDPRAAGGIGNRPSHLGDGRRGGEAGRDSAGELSAGAAESALRERVEGEPVNEASEGRSADKGHRLPDDTVPPITQPALTDIADGADLNPHSTENGGESAGPAVISRSPEAQSAKQWLLSLTTELIVDVVPGHLWEVVSGAAMSGDLGAPVDAANFLPNIDRLVLRLDDTYCGEMLYTDSMGRLRALSYRTAFGGLAPRSLIIHRATQMCYGTDISVISPDLRRLHSLYITVVRQADHASKDINTHAIATSPALKGLVRYLYNISPVWWSGSPARMQDHTSVDRILPNLRTTYVLLPFRVSDLCPGSYGTTALAAPPVTSEAVQSDSVSLLAEIALYQFMLHIMRFGSRSKSLLVDVIGLTNEIVRAHDTISMSRSTSWADITASKDSSDDIIGFGMRWAHNAHARVRNSADSTLLAVMIAMKRFSTLLAAHSIEALEEEDRELREELATFPRAHRVWCEAIANLEAALIEIKDLRKELSDWHDGLTYLDDLLNGYGICCDDDSDVRFGVADETQIAFDSYSECVRAVNRVADLGAKFMRRCLQQDVQHSAGFGHVTFVGWDIPCTAQSVTEDEGDEVSHAALPMDDGDTDSSGQCRAVQQAITEMFVLGDDPTTRSEEAPEEAVQAAVACMSADDWAEEAPGRRCVCGETCEYFCPVETDGAWRRGLVADGML